jgi:hypothetical protein
MKSISNTMEILIEFTLIFLARIGVGVLFGLYGCRVLEQDNLARMGVGVLHSVKTRSFIV